jgi:hypothetical protein
MKRNPMINRIIESLPGIVNLLALAMFFIFFSAFTSNTANISAWGFDGLAELGESRLGLLTYESTHTSPAYSAFLGGSGYLRRSPSFSRSWGNGPKNTQ